MKILVTGASGLLGRAIRKAAEDRWTGHEVLWSTRQDADLSDKGEVQSLLQKFSPDLVVNAAGAVGGILRNVNEPADLLLQNCILDSILISEARRAGVKKYLNFGSNCMYPSASPRPLDVSELFKGPVEPTNHAYAQAKLSALTACSIIDQNQEHAYKTLILSNLYGTHDNFEALGGHLLGAIVTKLLTALEGEEREVMVWGSGKPRREFTHADDVGDWLVQNIERIDEFPSIMNLGSGREESVQRLHEIAAVETGVKVKFFNDHSLPDGVDGKLLNSSVASERFDWDPQVSLEQGIKQVFWARQSRVKL